MNETEKIFSTVNISVPVSEERIKGLLCSAFEGGSDYWIKSIQRIHPNYDIADFRKDGKFNSEDHYWHPHQIIPLVSGCSLVITAEDDDNKYTLDRAALEKGLALMAEKHLNHFNDFVQETDDATTGDIFLQLCLFSELVYG
jgi:hypothetical protein